jgi:hypothetical protein
LHSLPQHKTYYTPAAAAFQTLFHTTNPSFAQHPAAVQPVFGFYALARGEAKPSLDVLSHKHA